MSEPEDLAEPNGSDESRRYTRPIFYCLLILVILLCGYTVIVAKPVLLPLVLALLVTLVLRPVHKVFCKLRFPGALAAAIVVLAVISGSATAVYYLAIPAVEWGETIDVEYVEERVREVLQPLKEVKEEIEDVADKVGNIAEGKEPKEKEPSAEGAQSEIQEGVEKLSNEPVKIEAEITNEGEGEEGESEVVEVEIREKATGAVFSYAQSIGFHVVATVLLIFFFLAYGEALHRRMAASREGADVFESVSKDVSAYLFTITAINFGLGVAVALAMWLLGMPNAVLWGVMAALLNFIPYLGALTGTLVVGLVSLVTYSTILEAAVVPLVYFGLTSLEGNVITPMIIGRRFSLNPIVVVVWFMCWGAMWGVPGMLIATPTLMGFKIVCELTPSLQRVNRIISK